MLSDALTNNDIEFVSVPVHGGYSQLNTPTGYKFYVKYADYAATLEIYDVLFSADESQQAVITDDPSSLIDRIVKVVIDRPYGSVHPEYPDIRYELNYGHVEDFIGGDGEAQDAYIIDYKVPLYVGKEISGYIIAVIRRKNDVETKWVVDIGSNKCYTKEEIARAVNFQEKFFDIEIIM